MIFNKEDVKFSLVLVQLAGERNSVVLNTLVRSVGMFTNFTRMQMFNDFYLQVDVGELCMMKSR
jgi:hypothetical protein